jgi:hypothetical protein
LAAAVHTRCQTGQASCDVSKRTCEFQQLGEEQVVVAVFGANDVGDVNVVDKIGLLNALHSSYKQLLAICVRGE